MKREAIIGIMQSVLPDAKRIEFGSELARLETTLQGVDATAAWLTLVQ
jgi:hypothetical protein